MKTLFTTLALATTLLCAPNASASPCTDGFILPPTAASTVAPDGSLELTVAAPWFVESVGGPAIHATQNCDCQEGSGCSPVFYGDRSGCEQESCNKCVGTRTGVVMDTDGVRVVGDAETDQLDLLDAERALDIPWVADSFDEFVDDALDGQVAPQVGPDNVAPPGWGFLLVSVHGHHVQLLVPETGVWPQGAWSALGSCSCSEGSGCDYKWLGPGSWTCKSNGCTGTCSASQDSFTVLAP